jgi:2-polyprenyl-6-methoxyphenol hydroxylase-like FAD-dependent oxidoreductase
VSYADLQMRRVRADNLELDSQEKFAETEARYGNRWVFFHRADLHTGLRNLVHSPIELASEVTKVDPETATITLADGRVIQKDLVVIADGAHVSPPSHLQRNLTHSVKTSQVSSVKKHP